MEAGILICRNREWIEKAEKEAGTSFGVDLGVNEPIDRAANNARKWFTSPLETRAVKRGGEKGGAAKQKVGMNRIEELKAQIANQRKVRESTLRLASMITRRGRMGIAQAEGIRKTSNERTYA